VEVNFPAIAPVTPARKGENQKTMASKPFEEKQTIKDVQPDKLPKLEKTEKHEKQEKNEKAEKESKDQKDNPDAKHKQEKDAPDTKHKQEKEKHEKEHKLETKEELLEKVHKDQETPMAQFSPAAGGAAAQAAGAQKSTEKLPQAEIKVVKEVKLEIKEIKHEKIEIKEHKHEKFEIKEVKLEKVEKLEYEGVLGGIGDPGGPVEQRLAALEAAVSQLMHFIPENLRPDLSQGALKQEPEAGKEAKPSEPKEPAKKK
jgi:hypothetical protein